MSSYIETEPPAPPRLRKMAAILMVCFVFCELAELAVFEWLGHSDSTGHLIITSSLTILLIFPVFKEYRWATGLAFVVHAWLVWSSGNSIIFYLTSPIESDWTVRSIILWIAVKAILSLGIIIILFRIRFKRTDSGIES